MAVVTVPPVTTAVFSSAAPFALSAPTRFVTLPPRRMALFLYALPALVFAPMAFVAVPSSIVSVFSSAVPLAVCVSPATAFVTAAPVWRVSLFSLVSPFVL